MSLFSHQVFHLWRPHKVWDIYHFLTNINRPYSLHTEVQQYKRYVSTGSNVPGNWVFVLAKPIISDWLRNRNASSGKGDTWSVISSKVVFSLNLINREDSVSRKLCAHLETSKPDTENIVPTMSLSRYCGRRLELIVTCIMVAWNIVRNLSVWINGVNFNRLSVPTLHNRKPKSLPNNRINTKPKSIYILTITLQSAQSNRSDQQDFIFLATKKTKEIFKSRTQSGSPNNINHIDSLVSTEE